MAVFARVCQYLKTGSTPRSPPARETSCPRSASAAIHNSGVSPVWKGSGEDHIATAASGERSSPLDIGRRAEIGEIVHLFSKSCLSCTFPYIHRQGDRHDWAPVPDMLRGSKPASRG
jgi:hypothetical protein